MRNKPWRVVGVAAVVIAVSGVVGVESARAATTTQVVRSFSVNSWFGLNEGPGGSVGNVTLVRGPATPPAGTGSAQLQVDSTGRASLGTNEFKGVPLNQITGLDYWGYVVGGTTNQLVLQFDVNYDTTRGSTSYQGRLVFVPDASPPPNAWRHLNAFSDGHWFGSQAPGNSVCSQATPCTWSQVLTDFPNAGVRNDPIAQGALLLRLGGPISGGATAFVDDLTVATTTSTTVVDFEPGASITPSIGPAGTQISMQAYGFHGNARVKVIYDSELRRHRHVTLCIARADATGAATCNGTIPVNAGPAGAHPVTISGRGMTSRKLIYTDDFVVSS